MKLTFLSFQKIIRGTYMEKIIAFFTSIFMAISSFFGSIFPGSLKGLEKVELTDELQLCYTKPAAEINKNDTWQEATLPIGNGILGANIYGGVNREQLSLNEETLWSGGRDANNPDDNYNGGNPRESKVETYNKIANAVLNGGKYDVEQLAGMWDGYANGYQPLGNLFIDFDNMPSKTPSDYLRTLNLEKGTSTVKYSDGGVDYERTFFASNPDNVIVAELKSSAPNLSFKLSFNSDQNGKSTVSVTDDGYAILGNAGQISDNGLLHNTQIAVVPQDGTATADGDGIKVKDASVVRIYICAATDYKNTFYNDDKSISYYYRTGENAEMLNNRVKNTVVSAVNKGYENVLNDHIRDYSDLYGRTEINLGQLNEYTTDSLLKKYQKNKINESEKRYLEVLLFQYGRYLLFSSSRENSQLPNNLQGIWNNMKSAPWNSDIHTNINEQMNYWLSGNCNLNECALPLVKYMASLAVPGHRTVEIYTGAKHGLMAHTQNTPFGFTAPGWVISTWGWSPAAATWLMQNCYDYYEFSGDTETLRTLIYPMMKEQVLMYEELLVEKDGRMVMPIAQSPEMETISAGNAYEQSLICQLYIDTVEAAKILGLDADLVPGWTTTMSKLKPLEIGKSGQIKEWYHEGKINSVNDTRKHRHLSNLLGLYPGSLFTSDELIKAAKVSLNNKNFGHTGTIANPEGGWTYAQLMGSWARVKSGENAYFSISSMIKNRLYANLWDYHNHDKYGAFQIDANLGYSAGMAEMLIQSWKDCIELLPAIPKDWNEGSFKGLCAEGNFTVDASWASGKITAVSITSGSGNDCRVKAGSNAVVTTSDGTKVPATYADGVITFATQKGVTYNISGLTY